MAFMLSHQPIHAKFRQTGGNLRLISSPFSCKNVSTLQCHLKRNRIPTRSIRCTAALHEQQLAQKCASIATAGLLVCSSINSAWADEVQPVDPVYDGANVIAAGREESITRQLKEFETETGWKVRLYTSNEIDGLASAGINSRTWKLDAKAVVIQVDPSRRGNIISVPYLGDDVVKKLRRPFWLELQSRYGNIFYIREEGEQTAVDNVMSTVLSCLGAEEGCLVPPGLPMEQFYFTLALSIAGGLVFGFASLLEPQGIVKSRWAWVLIFSPLWAILFINFGLGPVVVRTSEAWPVIADTAGFAAAAYFINLSPMFKAKLDGPSDSGSM